MTTCTADQLDVLLDYLQQNRDLARGILRNADGRLRAKRLWQELSELLNSLGGSIKTPQQWQKVWTDKKHLAKKNAAANRRSAAATGGGEGARAISSWEMKVLAIMGEGFGEPQTTARVPIVPRINFEDEVASYGLVPAEQGHSLPQVVEQEAGHWPIPEVVEQQEQTEDPLPPPPGNPTRTRTPGRRQRVATELSSLLQKEEEKVQTLKRIEINTYKLASAVQELVELMKNRR